MTNTILTFMNFEKENSTEKTNQIKCISGPAGVGKTQEAYKEIIEYLKLGKNVLLFSLETNLDETNKQIIRAALPSMYGKIYKGKDLSDEEKQELQELTNLIGTGNLSIVAKYPITEDEILEKITLYKESAEGLDLVVIDQFETIQRESQNVDLEERVKPFQLEQELKILITTQSNRELLKKEA